MGMHIAILPDADRGMPRWGGAPSYGPEARIGIDETGNRGKTPSDPATC